MIIRLSRGLAPGPERLSPMWKQAGQATHTAAVTAAPAAAPALPALAAATSAAAAGAAARVAGLIIIGLGGRTGSVTPPDRPPGCTRSRARNAQGVGAPRGTHRTPPGPGGARWDPSVTRLRHSPRRLWDPQGDSAIVATPHHGAAADVLSPTRPPMRPHTRRPPKGSGVEGVVPNPGTTLCSLSFKGDFMFAARRRSIPELGYTREPRPAAPRRGPIHSATQGRPRETHLAEAIQGGRCGGCCAAPRRTILRTSSQGWPHARGPAETTPRPG